MKDILVQGFEVGFGTKNTTDILKNGEYFLYIWHFFDGSGGDIKNAERFKNI